MEQWLQWALGLGLPTLFAVGCAVFGYFVSQHDRRIEKIEKRLDDHDEKDDQRFEKQTDRIGRFEKEFSAEVREALAKTYDRYVELKDWCREKFSK